jgi:hypothetical protein
MSSIAKQLLINKFNFPKEIIYNIKDYIFHKIKKIPANDERYQVLLTIPVKEYDKRNNSVFVYLSISDVKDYYIAYTNFEIQIQTLRYFGNNVVYLVDGSLFVIE